MSLRKENGSVDGSVCSEERTQILDQFTREGARLMRRVLLHAFYLYVAVGTTIGPERRSVQITIEQGLNQAVRASPS